MTTYRSPYLFHHKETGNYGDSGLDVCRDRHLDSGFILMNKENADKYTNNNHNNKNPNYLNSLIENEVSQEGYSVIQRDRYFPPRIMNIAQMVICRDRFYKKIDY